MYSDLGTGYYRPGFYRLINPKSLTFLSLTLQLKMQRILGDHLLDPLCP